jgi:hypothetical protein
MAGCRNAVRALVVFLPVTCGCAPDVLCGGGDLATCEPLRCGGPLSFAPAIQYDALSLPDGFVIADLNGDGKPDLVVPTHVHSLHSPGEVGHILVLINKGDGTFDAGVSYKIVHDPKVAVGDLDGDGRPEIVVSSSGSGTLTVLHNDGTGGFTAGPPLPVIPAPNEVSIGDVNGDGKPDVFWFSGGHLSVLSNQGGTVAGSPVSSVPIPGDVQIAGDLNGDGVIDVVSGEGEDVRVHLNRGDGTFLAPAVYPSPAAVSGLSLVGWRGAGATDILVTGTTDAVLLGDGKGTFPMHVTIPSPPPFTAVGDMNGDGKPDLVGLDPDGAEDAVVVWLNGGDDTFAAKVSAPVARFGVTVQVSDLNGDGLLDAIALSQPGANVGRISVLLGTCEP